MYNWRILERVLRVHHAAKILPCSPDGSRRVHHAANVLDGSWRVDLAAMEKVLDRFLSRLEAEIWLTSTGSCGLNVWGTWGKRFFGVSAVGFLSRRTRPMNPTCDLGI